jgi:hypothetical protein
LTAAKPVPRQVAHLLSIESGFVCFMFARKMTKFLLPSLQTEAGDLKDFSNFFQAGIYL